MSYLTLVSTIVKKVANGLAGFWDLFSRAFSFVSLGDSNELVSDEFKTLMANKRDKEAYKTAILKSSNEIHLEDGEILIITN